MLDTILGIISSFFDCFILVIYFEGTLNNRKKQIPLPLFWAGFLLMEFFLHLTPYLLSDVYGLPRFFLVLSYSWFSTLLLTLYYETTLRHRLFVTISFQLYSAFSESCIYFLIPKSQEDSTLINQTDYTNVWLFTSQFILLILVIGTTAIFKKKNRNYSLKYNLLLLLTPLFSVIILASTFFSEINSSKIVGYNIVILIGLLLINIINYYLLDNALQIIELKADKQQLEQQITFQANKYHQMSTAYRNTRSILHDTKKHFLYLQECIDKKEYDKIKDYLPTATKRLEAAYNRINTGNLVIDAFISNHLTMAEQEHISFQTNIQVVTDNIQIEDYDLCVILGNLLDNSFQACRKIIPPHPRKIEVQIFTTDISFVIHITNTKLPNEEDIKNPDTLLFHGYGLKNVDNISRKYNGNFSYFSEPDNFVVVVTIPCIKKLKKAIEE